jgi:hypothetical protein
MGLPPSPSRAGCDKTGLGVPFSAFFSVADAILLPLLRERGLGSQPLTPDLLVEFEWWVCPSAPQDAAPAPGGDTAEPVRVVRWLCDTPDRTLKGFALPYVAELETARATS